MDGLDAWWQAWQASAEVWNDQISTLESGDEDAMKSAFLGLAGESGAEFPEDSQLIFRDVTRSVLSREDLPEITAGIRDATGRIATEERRTAKELDELSPTVSTAPDAYATTGTSPGSTTSPAGAE